MHSFYSNVAELDYGPTVILRHTLKLRLKTAAGGTEDSSVEFYTLYGHLSVSTLVKPDGAARFVVGQAVAKGE